MVLEKINESRPSGQKLDMATVRSIIDSKQQSILQSLIQEGLEPQKAKEIASKKHVMLFIILDD